MNDRSKGHAFSGIHKSRAAYNLKTGTIGKIHKASGKEKFKKTVGKKRIPLQ